jgi:hypothetical protein
VAAVKPLIGITAARDFLAMLAMTTDGRNDNDELSGARDQVALSQSNPSPRT